MKRKLILVILLSLLVLCSLVSAQTACATWGIDYQHTGQSPYVGPHEGVRLLWYKPWTGYGKITMDSDGYIYHNLSNQSGKFDPNGNLIATYDHPSQWFYSWWPVISPNEDYVIIKNVVIQSDFQDGFLIEEGVISNGGDYIGSFTDVGNPLLFGELYNDGIYYIKEFNMSGTELWSDIITDYHYNDRGFYPTITYSSDIICANTYQYPNGGGGGEYEWFYDMNGNRTIDEDNNVYIFWSNRVCLDDEDGDELWSIDNSLGVYYPSWHPDGFLLANGNALYAFDPSDGSIIWGPVLEDNDQDTTDKPIIDTEGYIFTFYDSGFELACLEASGNEVYSYSIDNPISPYDWCWAMEHLI
ncbi:MAG: hypothetical protein GF403_06860, partial [Candidatus Coatesbacteria bacterium]|nr:hypothetical protein [Candidatus Coatesbacteria bacterium]